MYVLEVLTSVIRGGAEEVALTLARTMIREGWKVDLACPHSSSNQSLVDDLVEAGAGVHSLSIAESELGTGGMLRVMWKFIIAARLLFRLKPDVVFIHLPWQDHAMPVILASAVLGLPTIVMFHLAPKFIAISPRRIKVLNWARSRKQKWVSVSDHNRIQIAETFGIPPAEVIRIHNGANFTDRKLSVLEARFRIRQELGLAGDARIIISVCRLDKVKGLHDIVPAMRLLLKDYPDIKFVWAGEGPWKEILIEKLRAYEMLDSVVMLGRRTDIPDLLAASDIFLFPSHQEGLSLALLEAASSGIPVVASDSTSNPEIIKHMDNGLLFRTGDSCSLLEQLRFALANPEIMASLAGKARQDMGRFSLDAMLAQHMALCKQQIAN
jgi:glycosyltransferase involved in cell wall biosynthesis